MPDPNVLILGAGPAGLAMLHSLKRSASLIPIAYDPRPAATGLWHYNHLPSNIPDEEISPLYTNLSTNIPTNLMRFTTHDWPRSTVLFPDRTEVERYLLSYSEDVKEFIQFRTKVERIEKSGADWLATMAPKDGEVFTKRFKYVAIAGGNYLYPRKVPSFQGLQDWIDAGGKSIHSKYYRDNTEYTGLKVVVVGAGASGVDISRQVAEKAGKVLWSVRGNVEGDERLEVVGEIQRFSGAGRSVEFANGKIEMDVDAVIWCIGYYFLRPQLKLRAPVETERAERLQNLYQHLFYIHDTSLAFIGLPQKVIPFPIAQAQAATVRRVWENRLPLPDKSHMKKWEQDRLIRTGPAKFHRMPDLEDADYIQMLGALCESVEDEQGVKEGRGVEWPAWGGKERWLRKLIPSIRKQFVEETEKGRRVTSVEELGFAYDEDSDKNTPLERAKTAEEESGG